MNSVLKEMEEGNIYVLQLKDSKFYVGWSENIEERIVAHFSNEGSEWTKKHTPEKVIEVRPGGKLLEKLVTIEYMVKKGWDSVRGGPWTACALKSAPVCMRKSIAEDKEVNAERIGNT
jgi:predicted GIY-YIG superfamily endonuclease